MRTVIAVDGPSGVGKTSVSKQLAERLGWTYLDTGAMYRTVTLAWLRSGKKPGGYSDLRWLENMDLDFDGPSPKLDGQDVGEDIRSLEVTRHVSEVSANPAVRAFLTHIQRKIGARKPCILDGRDIGTVVFPDAFFKVFLTASPRVRAQRRWLQLGGDEAETGLETIHQDLIIRDHKDRSRAIAPLKAAADAFVLETDELSQDEVVTLLAAEAHRRLAD